MSSERTKLDCYMFLLVIKHEKSVNRGKLSISSYWFHMNLVILRIYLTFWSGIYMHTVCDE